MSQAYIEQMRAYNALRMRQRRLQNRTSISQRLNVRFVESPPSTQLLVNFCTRSAIKHRYVMNKTVEVQEIQKHTYNCRFIDGNYHARPAYLARPFICRDEVFKNRRQSLKVVDITDVLGTPDGEDN